MVGHFASPQTFSLAPPLLCSPEMQQSPHSPRGGLNTSTVQQMFFMQHLNLPQKPAMQCTLDPGRALPAHVNLLWLNHILEEAKALSLAGSQHKQGEDSAMAREASRRQQHSMLWFHGRDTLGTGPVPVAPSQCHPSEPAPSLGPSKFPTLPKETHLLCGLQPPGCHLCRSHCCHCLSCQPGLLSGSSWRGSLQHSQLPSLAPPHLQVGGEPSLVPGVLLGSWRGLGSL